MYRAILLFLTGLFVLLALTSAPEFGPATSSKPFSATQRVEGRLLNYPVHRAGSVPHPEGAPGTADDAGIVRTSVTR
ncbi:hypothetical protein [Paracoccus sp. (in: a-proteobacteria)]|uniref:hypothetical protein n=1 Tax=Paracoccus sp. TaxID=267 RepID=UPI00289C1FDB|nr:hypothetical protein [Paracoccus sp. (in: a-proteobacteria)]